MLDRLGDRELTVELSGDGAGSLVEAWAGADGGGRVALAVWNGTLDQSKVDGSALLGRALSVQFTGLTAAAYQLRHYRVDATYSNLAARWAALGGGDWPDEAGWAALRAADRLDELVPARRVAPRAGAVEIGFDLPMPSISLLELSPEGTSRKS
jgi:xylan 1,4-beta-xylosidase